MRAEIKHLLWRDVTSVILVRKREFDEGLGHLRETFLSRGELWQDPE
jgi:hypothetical protein